MRSGVRRLARIAAVVLPMAVLATGCGGGGGSSGTADVPQLSGAQSKDAGLVEGQKVWADNCTRCHGLNGQGGVGPELAGKVVAAFPDVDDQIALVSNGKGIMLAWKSDLTPAQIRDVVRYTREVL